MEMATNNIERDWRKECLELEVECEAWEVKCARLVKSDKKTELECQKWVEKCIGLEASNKILCEQKEEIIKRYQDLEIESNEPVISKEEYANLVKENERLEVLTGSFFNVFLETYRRVKPLGG